MSCCGDELIDTLEDEDPDAIDRGGARPGPMHGPRPECGRCPDERLPSSPRKSRCCSSLKMVGRP